ncbi:DUF3466 family protein [Ningiella sp. W23]|uniref:DUF3466 family protein n=1 Tax=Ningiella sp. W23 TaxID=3023715 RepID=UPI003756844B
MKYVSHTVSVALAALLSLSTVSLSSVAKPIYTIENLGTIGAPESSSSALALNESGQVVGSYTDADGNTVAFLWDAINGMQSLGTLGGDFSTARDINNHGQIVGTSGTGVDNQNSGFVYDSGVMSQVIDLTSSVDGGIKSSDAYGINDYGQILGSYSEAVFNEEDESFDKVAGETFLKSGEELELSGRLPGNESGASSVFIAGTNALNENGDYTGLAFGTSQSEDGGASGVFVKNRGEDIMGLGTLGGRVAFGFDINDRGTIVGRSRLENPEDGYHAFVYNEASGMTDMNDLFGFNTSNLRNINNNNMAVGWGSANFGISEDEPTFSPFLFDLDTNELFLLNDLLSADSDFMSLDFAYSINENNDIVGYGTTKAGFQRAFLMSFQASEVSAPSTIALMAGTLLLLGARRKSKLKS